MRLSFARAVSNAREFPRASARERGNARRTARRGGRATTTTTTCEIRTRDAVEKACAELEISMGDAQDERKLKRAFRASAMRTHPDIAGDASGEAFKRAQSAYRTLRVALLEREGSPSAAAVLGEDDVEWAEHDWRWKARYGDGREEATSRRKTEEERRGEVAAQLNRMKAGDLGAAKKRGKRVIKPIAAQRIPSAEEIAAMDSNAKTSFGKGRASRSSTNSAHDALSAQLEGLHRKRNIKARMEAPEVSPDEEAHTGVHYSTIKAIEDSEEERFLRLAKLAREWRSKQASWRETGSSDKMTPKELLQAAVQGASLGACA